MYLEVRNDSLEPVAVVNQPRMESSLSDETGKRVAPSMLPMAGQYESQWAVIPRDATLHSDRHATVGVPEKKRNGSMAVGGNSWGLRSGKYVLILRVLFEREADAPQNQWVGELTCRPWR